MKLKNVLTLLLFCLAGKFITAQKKYALLIGIDKYSPPGDYKPSTSAGRIDFPNLDGCKNDARSMASIIVSKFSFPLGNVDTLFDEKATRENILKGFSSLLGKCKKGDVAFFYYAGHGSQVKNSKSNEHDNKDESIVPSDTWKENVSDIRDKEFAKICNDFIDKGVKLTVITDCCHSGSLSRGPIIPGKFRYIPTYNVDANDDSKPTPPETRPEGNFLIFSAAQDNEFAQEQDDDAGNAHGAFTIALITALNQQSVNASALNLFSSLRAVLKGNGKKQEPVIGGTPERQAQTLFGLEKGTIPDKSLVAVIKKTNAKVELQGGFALSLNKGNELLKVYGNNDSVLLKIDTITGINRSIASVIKGSADSIKPGHFFEVSNWVSSAGPLIKIFVPGRGVTQETCDKILKLANELKAYKKIVYLKDLDEYDPKVTVYFEGDKCFMNYDGARKEMKDYSAASIVSQCNQGDTVFVEIPPTNDVAQAIAGKFKDYKAIKLVDDINDAYYVVYGAAINNGAAYGLRKAQVSLRDSLESMPLTTRLNMVSFQSSKTYKDLADSVFEYALKLSKIRGWLTLVSPTNDKSNFPYYLQLRHGDTDKPLENLVYKINEQYSLHLVPTSKYINATVGKKYIYVFAIDKNGKMTLGYPPADDGNVENKFPKYNNGNLVDDFKLVDFTVTEPTGTDNFFLLSTNEPITNYQILFDQEGVRGVDTRGAEETNPLADILNIGNETKARSGFDKVTPSNWCLLKLSVKSIH